MKPEAIILHHSATGDTAGENWPVIRKYHKEVRGWQDIGYHAGIERVGGVLKIQQGRPATMAGAHCPGWNEKALGFCFVGDFTAAPPPLDMIATACSGYIIPMMRAFHIAPDHIFMHRDKRQTACPGDAFSREYFLSILYPLMTEV